MTRDGYFSNEDTATDRHEWHAGRVVTVPGSTFRKSLIGTNLRGECGQRLKGSPYCVLDCQMRVGITAADHYLYPEASILRGKPICADEGPADTSLTNPRVVIEIWDGETEIRDRAERFKVYRQLESLSEYVVVSATTCRVESRGRDDATGEWNLRSWSGRDAVARLRSVEIDLPPAEIYGRITFDAAKAPINLDA